MDLIATIVRHGNTFDGNEPVRRIGARTDLPLVASGFDQARALGQKLGYHLADIETITPEAVRVTFRNRAHGPKLTLVK